ncbi:MAG TPA: SDR family NAD(P)-dependent oxidoreductase [Gammaproteobacteria bacterium]|nr:SDR family NAD(P)-dependent oxidoreductase [Gammaproteobacteria bacterium]
MKKSILITGCSSGIGLCAAETLHKRGYRVFATTRKEKDVAHLKAQGLESLILDINDSNSIRIALAEILSRTGGTLDALFNNAGFVQAGAVEDLSRDVMRAQFETNVFGPIELITQVLPIMRKQGHGRIIQNSSMLGEVTIPYVGAYNASKFALDGFTHTLRQELKRSPIWVSIIAPGPITSRLRANAKQHFNRELIKPDSVHKHAYKRIEERYSEEPPEKELRIAQAPDAVVKQLIHALESKHPKTHYYTGASAKIFSILRRLLPESLLDWVMIKCT